MDRARIAVGRLGRRGRDVTCPRLAGCDTAYRTILMSNIGRLQRAGSPHDAHPVRRAYSPPAGLVAGSQKSRGYSRYSFVVLPNVARR
jgi:hypothetical protein